MKKVLLFIFCILFINTARSQVTLGDSVKIATLSSSSVIAFNDADVMRGNSVNDRYYIYNTAAKCSLAVYQSGSWSHHLVVSSSNIGQATMAFHNDTIWACWREGTGTSKVLYVSYSINSGSSWSTKYAISSTGDVSSPSVYASSTGKVHFAWYKTTAGTPTVVDIYYCNHTISGGSDVYSSEANLTSGISYTASFPSITADGDSVYCAFKATVSGDPHVFFTRSDNGGSSWSTPIETSSGNKGKDPSVAFAKDPNTGIHYIYIAEDNSSNVYIQRTTAKGDNSSDWSTREKISGSSGYSQFAKVECNNYGYVGVSWEARTTFSGTIDTAKDVGYTYSTSFASASSFSSTVNSAYLNLGFGAPYASINKIDENNFYLLNIVKDTTANKVLVYERHIGIDTAKVTISQTSGSNPSCSGATVQFTANATNGGSPTYQWKVNGSAIGGETNSTYSPSNLTDGQTVTCVMTSSLGAVTNNPVTSSGLSHNITTNVTPSVSIYISNGTNPSCTSSNVTFAVYSSSNIGSSFSYQWYKNNAAQSGETNSTYSTTSLANNDSVFLIITPGSDICVSPATATSNSIKMGVSSSLTPSISIVADHNPACSTTTVLFTATPTNEGMSPQYTWKHNSTVLQGPSSNATYSTSGLTNGYTVKCVISSSLTCAFPAGNTSNVITMTINCKTGTTVINNIDGSNESNNAIEVYPNPSDGNVTMEFTIIDKSNYKIELRNVLGQLIYQESLNDYSGDYTKQINAAQYGKGMYIVNLSDGNSQITKNFMVY